jgi:hypothetical protein
MALMMMNDAQSRLADCLSDFLEGRLTQEDFELVFGCRIPTLEDAALAEKGIVRKSAAFVNANHEQ